MSHSRYAEYIKDILAELDEIWPGYQTLENGHLRGRPFNNRPIAEMMRIKWLLKRHRVLTGTSGDGSGLGRLPHNAAVVVIQGTINPQKCYAHPLDIDHDDPRAPAPPPRVGNYAPVVPQGPSASRIAVDLGLPLETVEEALLRLPDGVAGDDVVAACLDLIQGGDA